MINHKISVMDLQQNVLTPEEYNQKYHTSDSLLGIIVQTEILGLILSPVQWNDVVWSKDEGTVVTVEQSEGIALQTISGLEHTREIVQKQKDEDNTAAKICWNYDNGNFQWYLPSILEVSTIYAFKDEINEVIRKIDKHLPLLPECDPLWSSSEWSRHYAWCVYSGVGSITHWDPKSSVGTVRAVTAFSSLSSIGERVDTLANKEDCKSNVVGMTDEQLVQILRERGFTGAINKLINL